MNKIRDTYILVDKINGNEECYYPFTIDKVMVDNHNTIYVEGVQCDCQHFLREIKRLEECSEYAIEEVRGRLGFE